MNIIEIYYKNGKIETDIINSVRAIDNCLIIETIDVRGNKNFYPIEDFKKVTTYSEKNTEKIILAFYSRVNGRSEKPKDPEELLHFAIKYKEILIIDELESNGY